MEQRSVRIPVQGVTVDGDLVVPSNARGIVAFAHGSGSSRHSPRNRHVAAAMQRGGFASLLMDLLTTDEEAEDRRSGALRFDIPLLASRLTGAVDMLVADPATAELSVFLFGASTGAAAALVTAAERPERVNGVISRGGRPDLAGAALARVSAPTLLIVGGDDDPVVLKLNQQAAADIPAPVELVVVPGAGHLFEEPGALQAVIDHSLVALDGWLS